ncbi:MAG: transglutaminase-like cysteine peptidase [Aliarcobacter sp.]|jgi:predicted transglutaminase-like cysteine proteinase|nr:transglutaminase-like cysteine peptidase [Aliarcobacter sp.]
MKLIILIASLFTTNLFAEFIQFNSNIHSQVEKRVEAINTEINKIKNLPTIEEQAKEINRFFNFNIKYDTDLNVYGQNDYKATIEETVLTMRGDCDDIVIAKMQALLYLGIPSNQMYIVLSKENNQLHMKLYVKIENKVYVLDSLNKTFREITIEERINEVQLVKGDKYEMYISNKIALNNEKNNSKKI